MARRDYPPGVRAALWAVSSMNCYYPGCTEPTVLTIDGEPEVNVDIAHISGLHPQSARYRADMTDGQRNAFSNLIPLCRPHHRRVDRRSNAEKFPVEALHEWKAREEAGRIQGLQQIRGLTEAGLRKALKEIEEDRNERLEQIVAHLEAVAPDDAAVIHEVLHELRLLRNRRAGLDPDVVHRFAQAARQLQGFPDTVPRSSRAVEKWVSSRPKL